MKQQHPSMLERSLLRLWRLLDSSRRCGLEKISVVWSEHAFKIHNSDEFIRFTCKCLFLFTSKWVLSWLCSEYETSLPFEISRQTPGRDPWVTPLELFYFDVGRRRVGRTIGRTGRTQRRGVVATLTGEWMAECSYKELARTKMRRKVLVKSSQYCKQVLLFTCILKLEICKCGLFHQICVAIFSWIDIIEQHPSWPIKHKIKKKYELLFIICCAGSGLLWNREKEAQQLWFLIKAQRTIAPQPGLISVIRKI